MAFLISNRLGKGNDFGVGGMTSSLLVIVDSLWITSGKDMMVA
jgi:hypothetical protein